MRLAVVMEGVPDAGTSGGAMAMWTLLRYLSESGHIVTAVLLLMETDRAAGQAALEQRRVALEELGVDVLVIDVVPQPLAARRLKGVLPSLTADPESLFAHRAVRDQVRGALQGAALDSVLAF